MISLVETCIKKLAVINDTSALNDVKTMYFPEKIKKTIPAYIEYAGMIESSHFISKHSEQNKENILVSGYIQSGKTNEMLFYCWWSIFIAKRTVIFLTRNIRADAAQLKERLVQFNDKFVRNKRFILDESDGRLIIKLANYIQVKKLLGTENYNLCIDECDFAIKSRDNSSKLEKYLKILEINAKHQLGATATEFAVISASKITKIYKLPAPANYYSISDLNVQYVQPLSDTEIDHSDVLSIDPNINTIYSVFLDRVKGIMLHSVTKFTRLQERIAEALILRYPELCTVVYNGQGISVYSKSSKCIGACVNEIINKKYYIHFFKKGTTINSVIQILADNGFSHISIVAGYLASRGISFVSSDYKSHLTDQYLQQSPNVHGETLLQGLRILGCYNDAPELTLWCPENVWRKIKNQNNILKKYINDLGDGQALHQIQTSKPLAKYSRKKVIKGIYYNDTTGNVIIEHIDANEEEETEDITA